MATMSTEELTILVVEPSPTQSKVIVGHMEDENIGTIDTASSLDEALSQIYKYKPDLVVSSLYFKDGTGLDLLRKIRQDSELQDLPFMLISSETRRTELEEFKQSGAVAILPKPFTVENLNTALNATLELLSEEELDLEFFDVASIRTLAVDDSRIARKMVIRVLNNLGIVNITEASDGAEAITILKHQSFDLVVTDYNMPAVNGAELTEYIRNSSAHAHVPVLMVSSEANETHLSNIAQSGVDALVDKPFLPNEVKRLLYNLFGNND